jgi:hypothetical protein
MLDNSSARGSFEQPRFRSPSVISFAFDWPPRAIHADKGGIELKQTRRRLTRRRIASEMGESGGETMVSYRIGWVLTLGFLPHHDGLVEATKLNKGHPHSSKRPVEQRVYRAHARGAFKAPDRFLRQPRSFIDPAS